MYQSIVATLGYILSKDKTQVLLIHRNKRLDDNHYGKYNGLGGRLEPAESVAAGMRREILEEAGLVVDTMLLRGTISWTGFGNQGENWFGFIFRIDAWHGEAHAGNHEGVLTWVDRTEMLSLPMWPSDKLFLPMVFDDDPRIFHGAMPFHNGQMVSWDYERF
jgi:8-oxo-dGTP diphosphatase